MGFGSTVPSFSKSMAEIFQPRTLKYLHLPGRTLGGLFFGWEHERFWHHKLAFLVIVRSEEQLQPAVVNLNIRDIFWVLFSGCPAFCQAQSCNFFQPLALPMLNCCLHLLALPSDSSTFLSSPLPPSLLPNPPSLRKALDDAQMFVPCIKHKCGGMPGKPLPLRRPLHCETKNPGKGKLQLHSRAKSLLT